MCELFGASLHVPIELKDYLSEFYSHCDKHPHGWGIMRYHDQSYEVIKEPVKASESKILPNIIEKSGKQKNLLAHIRMATVGSIREENCHPYTGVDITGRTWTMIHNGTIYSSGHLFRYMEKQKGDTDSERVLLYLLDLINEEYKKTNAMTEDTRIDIVDKLVRELSKRNKLNLMIFDGEILYIHKNMKNTLSYKELPEGKIFATTPLDEQFVELPMCKLFAVKDGEFIFESKELTEEFVPTLEYISAMAAMNI